MGGRTGARAAAGYEILEHTADVGILAWGESLPAAFEQVGRGLVEILGAAAREPTARRTVRAAGSDDGAVVVDFLNELLLLHETEEVALGAIAVTRCYEGELEAQVGIAPLAGEPEGVGVKAATYHRLSVERRADGGAEIRVYLDV